MKKTPFLLIAALAAACSENKSSTPNPPPVTSVDTARPSMNRNNLAMRIGKLGYKELFLLTPSELDSLWNAEQAQFAPLVADPAQPAPVRFLAAEVLFEKQPGFRPADPASLALAYADALRSAQLANPWGMPGQLDGPCGQHLVSMGAAALPALIPLLTDANAVPYGGSKEATVGNAYRYRVKDFAAFFISRIKNLPYAVSESPDERDTEIEKLRKSL